MAFQLPHKMMPCAIVVALNVFIVWFFWLKRAKGTQAAESLGGYQEAMILVKGGYTPDTIIVRHGHAPGKPDYRITGCRSYGSRFFMTRSGVGSVAGLSPSIV